MRVWAPLTLFFFTGCPLPQGELLHSTDPVKPFTTCEAAVASARGGDPCRGITTCERTLSACCFESLSCVNGLIVSGEMSCGACPCTDDLGCAEGSWCISGRCQLCPNPTGCAPCPRPLVQLSRNGCATCDCGPASDCACTGSATCQDGAYCLGGCTGRDCCLKFCAEPGCTTPNPEGCARTCPEACPEACIATQCQCLGGQWSCVARCGSQLQSYITRCVAP